MRAASPHSVVVGGTRGHGRAWVKLLCAKGHAVSVLGRHQPADADRKLTNVRYFLVDLSRPKTLKKTCAAVAARGPLDTLTFFQRYRGGGDSWNGELAVSLTATKSIIEAFLGRFSSDGSRSIVAVGSTASSLIAHEQPLSYHVAKAGLHQLVRYYAATLGPKRLRVNMVSPTAVLKAESMSFYSKHKSLLSLYKKIIPLGRMGTPKEITGAIDFLCSPQAGFITGHDLVMDGGSSLVCQETLARSVSPLASLQITRRKR
ncbi:MAG: SDR family oxidoreductase [Elusimicrobia bacterium]|nr:SDR family oxidoreductase [Elusimicrobiota bacterium]